MEDVTMWRELSLSDNFLFQKVMRNKRLCKKLIEKILQIKVRDITYPEEEKTIQMGMDIKSIRLDVYVEDDKGTVYDLEMQTTSGPKQELPKRTRYYQGMIDMNLIEKGEDYENLNPCFIVFICTFDPFHRGLPMYTFTNRCHEDGEELGDETTKLFLSSPNYEEAEDPELRNFLQYIEKKVAEGAFAKELDEEVKHVKSQEETRREYMTLAMEIRRQRAEAREEALAEGMELGMEKGIEKGIEKGMEKGKLAAALEMLKDHMPTEMVAKYTHLSVETIQGLAKQNKLL